MHHLTFWEIANITLLENTSHRIFLLHRLKSLLQVYWHLWLVLPYVSS